MISRRGRAGATVLLGLVALTSCTPGPVAPTPAPVPPVSQSPTETPQERQERLDYAAAEKSYRTFRAEYDKVLRAGGADRPTRAMKETAAGTYLATFADVVTGFKKLGSRHVGSEKIGYVRGSGHTANSLILKVCEDSRDVKTVRKSGKTERGDIIVAEVEVRRVAGDWKLWDGSGSVVKSCD